MTETISKPQIRAIKALQARCGLDDETYRDMLETRTGKRSSTALTRAEAVGVIDHLKASSRTLQNGVDDNKIGHGARSARGAMNLSGPYAGVCRALWLSAWNLGLIRERTDRALVAFVTRQTGIAHLNWVRDPVDGSKVIEALKAWIAREAYVIWPTAAEAKKRHMPLSRARKLAVIAAQEATLGLDPRRRHDLSEAELDETTQALGRAIRAASDARAAAAG